MVLPSQDARPVARHSYMYRRTRFRQLRRVLTLLAVVGLAWAAWAIWPSGGGEDDAQDARALATGDHQARDNENPADDVGLPANAFDVTQQRDAAEGAATALGRAEPSIDLKRQSPEPGSDTPADDDDGGQARITMGDPTPVEIGEQNRQTDPPITAPPASRDNGGTIPSKRYREPLPAQRNRAQARMQAGLSQIAENRLVEARLTLTQALDSGGLDSVEEDRVRMELTEINRRLVFSPVVFPGDPYAMEHRIEPGQALSKVVPALGLKIDYRLLVRINGLPNANRIRAGDRIKVLTGPFHCVVYKSEHRMDVYMGQGSQPVYVCSFPVGLGKNDGTPVGRFMVKKDSKLINPAWTNPETYEHYDRDDPNNPIGEFWIGLEGIDDDTRNLRSYGIHGTIEPESIGGNASMGCIRMHAEDIAIVYEMLIAGSSVIHIRESRGGA